MRFQPFKAFQLSYCLCLWMIARVHVSVTRKWDKVQLERYFVITTLQSVRKATINIHTQRDALQ